MSDEDYNSDEIRERLRRRLERDSQEEESSDSSRPKRKLSAPPPPKGPRPLPRAPLPADAADREERDMGKEMTQVLIDSIMEERGSGYRYKGKEKWELGKEHVFIPIHFG